MQGSSTNQMRIPSPRPQSFGTEISATERVELLSSFFQYERNQPSITFLPWCKCLVGFGFKFGFFSSTNVWFNLWWYSGGLGHRFLGRLPPPESTPSAPLIGAAPGAENFVRAPETRRAASLGREVSPTVWLKPKEQRVVKSKGFVQKVFEFRRNKC